MSRGKKEVKSPNPLEYMKRLCCTVLAVAETMRGSTGREMELMEWNIQKELHHDFGGSKVWVSIIIYYRMKDSPNPTLLHVCCVAN